MIPIFERSPQCHARIAGVLYLTIILLGLFGELFARGSLVISGDATATASAILGSPTLWRAGIVGDLLMHVLDVPVMVAFYLLLRPVSESLALLATFLNLVQTAVLVANKLNLLVPLFLMQDAGYLKAFSTEQLHALSYLAIKAHGYGFGIGLIFFAFACLVRGLPDLDVRVLSKAPRAFADGCGTELPGKQRRTASGTFIGRVDLS